MRAKQFAICDKDVVYLKMLQAYLQKKNPADFEILIFETAQKALAASRNEPFEVFLVGEKIYDNQIAKINAKKVFILLEDGLSGITGYSTLSKYQSMERLISQVLPSRRPRGSTCRPHSGFLSSDQTALCSVRGYCRAAQPFPVR